MGISSDNQLYLKTAHLLRRAGFGASPQEIATAAQAGIATTTESLLNYEKTPDNIDDDFVVEKIEQAVPENAKQALQNRIPVIVIQAFWTYRMLASPRSLQEKMVLFWANHFTSADPGDGTPLYEQNELYRRYALGNFRTLTTQVSKNTEMLRYLNGNTNYKAHPNENYARELMELFTCGRVGPDGKPNYTEDDIKASARAFSGWNLRAQQFGYRPEQHDETDKTFMGRIGNLNGDDVVDILVSLPATGFYICNKLFRFFAYDDPEPDVLASLVKTYFDSGYEIKPVVRQILTSDAFYSQRAHQALIKSPAEFVVGSVKALGLTPQFAPSAAQLFGDDPNAMAPVLPGQKALGAIAGSVASPNGQQRRVGQILGSPVGRLIFLVGQMRNMGQNLLSPPSVKGWDGGETWINTDTLQARVRFANALSNLPIVAQSDLWQNLEQSYQTGGASGLGARIIDAICDQLGGLQITDQTRSALLSYAQGENDPRTCARGILALIMSTSEYQCG